MNELKIVHSLYACCKSENNTSIRAIIEREDLEDIFMKVYYGYFDGNAGIEDLSKIIDILNYLEEEASISSPVSDTIYDMILAVLNDSSVINIGIGDDIATDGENVREHKYPELRGSLQKVHYATTDQIPEKDSRKSLEDFLRNALQTFLEENPDEVVTIVSDFKWDGLSNVFECSKNKINYVLTRYKVKMNLGKDISHVYQGMTPKDIFGRRIPEQFYDLDDYGVKTEVIVPKSQFKEYKKYTMDSKCNRRSAASSILNRTPDNFDPEMLKFLEVVPLQISTPKAIPGDPDQIIAYDFIWIKAGIINGRHQYIGIYVEEYMSILSLFKIDKTGLSGYYEPPYFDGLANNLYNRDYLFIKDRASKAGKPIDGIVYSLFNDKLIQKLGRSNDKNNFQVAFKFPAGIAKTILLGVDFQVGPIAGTITPVAIIEPIRINGNRISHIGLSNMDKLERLDLYIGDEIIVQYDIIPKIIVNDTCVKGTGDKVCAITNCPVCGGDIVSGRCINPNCDSKIVGRVTNYTDKMNIPKFGIETVTALVNRKIITSIADLYKLSQRSSDMLEIPGFGEESVRNIIHAPLSRTSVYPHELIGSIGIADISLATMEKVCRAIDIDALLNCPESLFSMYQDISGIGEVKANKIVDGLNKNSELIRGLLPYFTFKKYDGLSTKNVVFTGIRDSEFADFLKDSHGISSAGSVSSNTIAVIVKDGFVEETDKLKSARKKGIPIMKITEAKEKWGYKQK